MRHDELHQKLIGLQLVNIRMDGAAALKGQKKGFQAEGTFMLKKLYAL